MGNQYTGTTAAFQEGSAVDSKEPSATHAWLIIVGAVALMWLLGGVVFRRVRI